MFALTPGDHLCNILDCAAGPRYLAQTLCHLDLHDDTFELALCSAFLFTYTEQLSLDFHIAAIEEMCRVASEAHIFPLLKSYGGPSQNLEPVLDGPRERGYGATIIGVPYEFQPGGDQILALKQQGATAVGRGVGGVVSPVG